MSIKIKHTFGSDTKSGVFFKECKDMEQALLRLKIEKENFLEEMSTATDVWNYKIEDIPNGLKIFEQGAVGGKIPYIYKETIEIINN